MSLFKKSLFISLWVFVLAPAFAFDELTPNMDFLPDDSIEEIRDKIEAYGYEFTVDHNWVFDMSPEDKANFYSRHRPTSHYVEKDDIGPLAQHLGRDLPTSFDWRSYNGHSYIGPVRNQGGCGSCYSFGANAAAEGTYNFATGRYDSNCVDLSESYIIWCLGRLSAYSSHFFGCGGADYTYSELTALCNEGVTYEANFPYQESDPGSCTHWSDPVIRFQSWYRVPCNDITAIKTAIMTYGVVDAAVYVDSAFEGYSGGIYSNSSTTCSTSPCYNTPTNHAISLVGWNDNSGNGYWILRNSWGEDDWGEDGYMRISYTSARVACEVCYLVYNSTSPTATPAVATNTPTRTPTRTPTTQVATSTPTRTPTRTPTSAPPTSTPAGGTILLVDDDNSSTYETYYETALTTLGKSYTKVTGSPTLAQLNAATAVIWFCGDDYSTTLSTTDQTNLTSYLNAGGKLFLSGQDIGYDIRSDGTFYANYLKASYLKDDTNYYTLTGAGFMAGVSTSITGTGGANNSNYPSSISAVNGSSVCYSYANGDGAAGVCYSGTYKLVYFAFPFEAISSATDRASVLNKVLTYLAGTTPTSTPGAATSTPLPPTSTAPPMPTNTPVPPTSTPTSAGGNILVVDDDVSKSYQTYYTSAITAAGYSYTLYTVSTNGPAWSTMDDYTAVVWLTGDDYSTTLTSTDVTNLTTYLNNGGKLFISGQDIGYDITGQTFYTNYLKSTYNKDDTNNTSLTGVTGSIMAGVSVTITGTGGANNQNYPSGITANGSTAVFNYGGTGNGAAGVQYSGTYKLVYFSFGFEAISTSANRNTVMSKVLYFLTH